MTKQIVITLGQKGDDIVKSADLPVKKARVSSALLYDASPDRTGSNAPVLAGVAGHLVRMPGLQSVLFYDDVDDPHGVEQVDLHVRLPAAPAGAAASAGWLAYEASLRELVLATLQAFNEAGWSRHIEPGNPRLQGKPSYLPAWKTNPDPEYSFSPDEWKAMSSQTWRWMWRANGAVAQLVYQPAREGAVVLDSLSIRLSSERLYVAAHDPRSSGDAAAGKRQLEKDLPFLLQQREQRETQARMAGIAVMDKWSERPLGDSATVSR